MRPKPFIVASIIASLLLLFVSPSILYAQETDYARSFNAYNVANDTYKKSHTDYLLAKGQYDEAKTLASQSKLITATTQMLLSRDDVVITYLRATKEALLMAPGMSDSDKDALVSLLDAEIDWYVKHKETLPSAGTLVSLSEESAKAKTKFVSTEKLSYEVYSQIPISRVELLRSRVSDILAKIKTKTEEVRQRGDHSVLFTERWILETENKITRSIDEELKAQALLGDFKPNTKSKTKPLDTFNTIVTRLQESNQLLREGIGYMREIILDLKKASPPETETTVQ